MSVVTIVSEKLSFTRLNIETDGPEIEYYSI